MRTIRQLFGSGAVVIATCCLLAACAGAPSTEPTALPGTSVPSIDLQPCKLGEIPAQCGSLSVLEDRDAQDGHKINLRVAVIKARSDSPAPDPIFWLAGGPGGAATDSAPYAMQVLGRANETRDLVFVDQRGTGGSNELTCPQPPDADRQVEELRACLTRLDADPGAYTSAWAMDDVDDVRAALGYDQINLYGESYGATAAQVYLLRHESRVRTVAVGGASLLDVPMFERYPASSQKALEALFARCNADPACHSAFPNLREEFAEMIARLEQAPVTLPMDDPDTGKPLLLKHEMASTGIHNMLVRTDTAVLVPMLVHLLYNEDLDGVVAFLRPLLSPSSSAPTWKVMNLVILCHEEWAKTRRAETDAASAGSYLRYSDVRALTVSEEICAAVPAPDPSALYGPVTGSSVPILLVNGEADPQDPPENVDGAKQLYPNSLALVAPGQGHGYTGIPCRAEIVAQFIEQGSADGLQTGCLEQVELPDFVE